MAIARWFGGIPIEANIWYGSTMVAEANKDTYFISFRVASDTSNKFVDFKIYGEPYDSPVSVPIQGFHHPVISIGQQFTNNTITKLKESSIVVPVVKPDGANTWTIAYGTYAWLEKIGGNRTDDVVLKSLNQQNRLSVAVIYKAPNANLSVGEVQIDPVNKFIVQPAHQGGRGKGAVADELNVVSTSGNDTIAGSGMQKGRIAYWDANLVPKVGPEFEMAGLTPVDILSAYPDLYLIKALFGTQFGASNYNEGNIFLQEDV